MGKKQRGLLDPGSLSLKRARVKRCCPPTLLSFIIALLCPSVPLVLLRQRVASKGSPPTLHELNLAEATFGWISIGHLYMSTLFISLLPLNCDSHPTPPWLRRESSLGTSCTSVDSMSVGIAMPLSMNAC